MSSLIKLLSSNALGESVSSSMNFLSSVFLNILLHTLLSYKGDIRMGVKMLEIDPEITLNHEIKKIHLFIDKKSMTKPKLGKS